MKSLLIEALPTMARGSTICYEQPLQDAENVGHSDDDK